ncbi:sensor histidine kinase [Caenibacillus caldisaponilyticus]|uniref:sensor histidine kinase n=1 Tax=Caenibacillus caldisaponilyticus TaxID=1674942 RepID=UPI00098836C4|nr:sensor histidine kinase [Caenibacillus caldisaponilyticus]
MIRFRTKLMIFFLLLILVMNGVSYLLYHGGQRSIDQYDRLLQRFYLLNEISHKAETVYQTLNAYLVERTPEYYRRYLDERLELRRLQEDLSGQIENEKNYLTVENYRNMITSFLDECGIVSDAFQKQNIDAYSEHMAEAESILHLIQQTTLTLTNDELTQYHQFYENMNMKNKYFQSMGISVFVTVTLLSVLFALYISRGITRPIARLSAAAREISKGKFDGKPVEVSTRDEFRFLTHTFNDMRENIRNLIGEIQKKSELDRLLKEMELKSLQNQIHPHFLFNVLNTITRTAYLEGAEKTSELIEAISALLRHNLSRLDRPTTLGKEMEIIEKYFFLQKARFGDRVRFIADVDESCLDLKMPNLTLQPLVENAFIHGVESYENGGEIRLRIKDMDEAVLVEIADNGVGMDAETVRRLLQWDDHETDPREAPPSPSGHSTGLGFKNVVRRLQLFFDRTDIVTVDSAPGKGTTVSLRLPKTSRAV